MIRLADCFPDAPGATPLRNIDWMEFGVTIPYVIFFTGRCGSALLNGWLADTGRCGQPDEYFNESRARRLVPALGTGNFSDYFRAVVRRTASYGRFGVTIDPFRFPQLPELIDLTSVFAPGQTVFFWLTRRDLVGQAWSYANAKQSGLWHEFADGSEERDPPEPAPGTRAAVTDQDWWRELVYILIGEQRMERHFAAAGIAPHRLDYERLVAHKRGTVTRILRALSCMPDEIARMPALSDRTRRHHYDDGEEARIGFEHRYAAELQEIAGSRRTIAVDQLRQDLRTRHALELWR
jgi:LPS sulfotransferase NodH